VKRAISHTEVSTMLDCPARWDFAYGKQLAGSALQPKQTPTLLSEGKAWGAAVAALHADGYEAAFHALDDELEVDAREQEGLGVFSHELYEATREKLLTCLEQYAEETEIMVLEQLEREFLVPLPSRSGKGKSNRYQLRAFFDGIHTDPAGRIFLVEFKLRKTLSSFEMVANNRQIRRYAWAYRQETGEDVAGVIVDERLNAVPKPPRLLKSGKVSEAKDKLTTSILYKAACEDIGQEINPEVVEALDARVWQQRHTVFFTDSEIEEAGKELVSLGQRVQALDSGREYPTRNSKPQLCNGCRFKDICNNPGDTDVVDALYRRVPAKRDLPPLELAA